MDKTQYQLEDFLFYQQEELFDVLADIYRENAILQAGNFILVRGEAPVLLVAHLDTVHQEPVRDLCMSEDKNILMSPQGVGGDDRCGVYGLVRIHQAAQQKPWLLFTCNEEIGCVGAQAFVEQYNRDRLPEELADLKLIIEMDRRGSNDAVYYGCNNPALEAYITSKGFVTGIGSCSDISHIAPALDIGAVNLSSGYYHAHTRHEYINRAELQYNIERVIGIVQDSTASDFPRFEYLEYNEGKYSNMLICDYCGRIIYEEDVINVRDEYGGLLYLCGHCAAKEVL